MLPGTSKVGPVGDDNFGEQHFRARVVHRQVIRAADQRHTEHVRQLLAVHAAPVLN